MIEPKGRGVLDTPLARGMTANFGAASAQELPRSDSLLSRVSKDVRRHQTRRRVSLARWLAPRDDGDRVAAERSSGSCGKSRYFAFGRIASGVSGCASGCALAKAGNAIAVSKMRFTVG